MNAVNINVNSSIIVNKADGLILRFGLLVSDSTYSAGDLHNAITIDDYLNRDTTIKQKIDFLLLNANSRKENSTEEINYYTNG